MAESQPHSSAQPHPEGEDVKSRTALTPEEQQKVFKSKPTPTQAEQDAHRLGRTSEKDFKHEPDGSPPDPFAMVPPKEGIRAAPLPPPETPVPTQAELDAIASGHSQPPGYKMGTTTEPIPPPQPPPPEQQHKAVEADHERGTYKNRAVHTEQTRGRKEDK